MGFTERAIGVLKEKFADLKQLQSDLVNREENKARDDLKKARTSNEREIIKLRLRRKKAEADKKVVDARIVTQNAEAALKKAKRTAGDRTVGERLSGFVGAARRSSVAEFGTVLVKRLAAAQARADREERAEEGRERATRQKPRRKKKAVKK